MRRSLPAVRQGDAGGGDIMTAVAPYGREPHCHNPRCPWVVLTWEGKKVNVFRCEDDAREWVEQHPNGVGK